MEVAAYRTSHAAMMSTARPKAMPCTAAITGCVHLSMAEMAFWNFYGEYSVEFVYDTS